MKASDMISSAWPVLVCAGTCAVLCVMVLAGTGASSAVVTVVVALVIGSAAIALAIECGRRRAFCRALASCADGIDNPLWTPESLREPDYPEGRLAYQVIRAIGKAANDEVAANRRQTEEYREYVETWVHEAKSPLAAAHLMIENLMEGAPADEVGEALLEKTEALGEELERVEGYVEQALFYARSESLDRDYLIRPYKLQDLVGAAVRANARALIAAHVAPFRVDLDYTVFTDEKWMSFILGQMVQNSVKYAREEGAEIVFSGKLLDRGGAHERIELTVRDNGCGVAEADVPRVFDRGFTGENGRTGKRSTGIGLYLVKRLCDKMGLAVRASSRVGEFFELTISFPTNKMHYFE